MCPAASGPLSRARVRRSASVSGGLIACDYDIKLSDVLQARHFDDDVFCLRLPRFRATAEGWRRRDLRDSLPGFAAAGMDNLLVAGMMITSDHEAHMSTRNTVSCMGQGQAAGTAAAPCAARNRGTRDLSYANLRAALVKGNVYFE